MFPALTVIVKPGNWIQKNASDVLLLVQLWVIALSNLHLDNMINIMVQNYRITNTVFGSCRNLLSIKPT